MRPRNTTVILLTWLIAWGVPLTVGCLLAMRANRMRRPDAPEARNHIHLPAGIGDGRGDVLFSLKASPGAATLIVVPGTITPTTPGNAKVTKLAGTDTILIGRYFYQLAYTGGNLRWELVGARMRFHEVVGRNPTFDENATPIYEPKIENGRDLALWLNGLPSRAFTTLAGSECGAAEALCIDVHDGIDRITIERRSDSGNFLHVFVGKPIPVHVDDVLWIANFPYRLTAVPNAKEADLLLDEDYKSLHGNRSGLGAPGLSGTGELNGTAFLFEDISSEFRANHLATRRWDPETEDDLQRLIDASLLCLTYRHQDDRIVPHVDWTDLASGVCRDPLGLVQPQRPAGIGPALLKLYVRQRQNDQLIRRTNDLLARLPAAAPDDFPLDFEWWPVTTPTGAVTLPVRIWGVRTGSTGRNLIASTNSGSTPDPLEGAVVLRSRSGAQTVLARNVAGDRVYASGEDLLGLGPLLGIRGSVDGLDEITPAAIKSLRQQADSKAPQKKSSGPLTLTIDPDLQAALWAALKSQAAKIFATPPTYEQSPYFGLSAVVMDAENGDILSVLNWPSGLIWEDSARLESLRAGGSWGVPIPPLNEAMLRAEKVGSVFKIMAMYAMSDAGVLDLQAGPVGPLCGKRPFGAMATRAGGRVERLGGPFEDGQLGPLPTGLNGLARGLDGATATSCNTYFAYAATMLLNSNPPEIDEIGTCPIDQHNHRTDTGQPTSRQWLLCTMNESASTRRPAKGGGATNWLLLPEGEDLGQMGHRAFTDAKGGYFTHILHAGFRFLYRDSDGRLRGRDAHSYEGTDYRNDWMAGMPGSEEHVFLYPAVFSPLSHFGGGAESWDGITQNVDGKRLQWHDFAAQAIGEAGQGSALTVAAMYSAVARNDGAMPAPRLVHQDTVSTSHIFDLQNNRLERIRQALRQPLISGSGTARALGAFLKHNQIDMDYVLGKTGTFSIQFQSAQPAGHGVQSCPAPAPAGCPLATAESLLSDTAISTAMLGATACEKAMVTPVHRYPQSAPATAAGPQGAAKVEGTVRKEIHTTFAGIFLPHQQEGHPLVAVLISDLNETGHDDRAARNVIAPLMKAISDWMH
jgi:hypothetical protein